MAKKAKAAPKKAAAAGKKKGSGGDILVVQSKVREYLKGQGDYNVGADLVPAVSGRVEEMLSSAAKRAKENGRKTIQARDV